MIFNRKELQAIISSVDSNFVAACAMHFERLREQVAKGEAEVRYSDTATFRVFRRVAAEMLESMTGSAGSPTCEDQPVLSSDEVVDRVPESSEAEAKGAVGGQPNEDRSARFVDGLRPAQEHGSAQTGMSVPPSFAKASEDMPQAKGLSAQEKVSTAEIMRRGREMLARAQSDPLATIAFDIAAPTLAA